MPQTFPDTARPWRQTGRLRVMTLNIWFGWFEQERRTSALIDVLATLSPDFVALQEMTVPVLRQLAGDSRLADYWFSDRDGRTFDSYGVVLLARRAPDVFSIHPFTSAMNRSLVEGVWSLPGGDLQVGAVHLESKQVMRDYRLRQLRELEKPMNRGDWSLLMGDFNFCHSFPENDVLPEGFHDLWPLLNPGDPGWTVDTDINKMRLADKGKEKQVRFDRILLAPRKPGLRPESMQLVGNQALEPGVLLSDHFGLCLDCVLEEAELLGRDGANP
ncbi:endonuclease/exonuclease/phosphatase family protein [Acanthopleuribacter pedis]|uniref:Endonuclease/exonuclease/phosphatase family protein n=1 Tax=Acanthopleuribacter pedis TaxID=442870 RepID=A0A8J7Q5B4_9BACT|nr:endonuclease/exonuclease/phosphatase family protein [Acanthopleuribacter pedis]MBO1320692.1 endonuclease/exonuclease/phosphatase family protein [Acanthopleuribacter pedis]